MTGVAHMIGEADQGRDRWLLLALGGLLAVLLLVGGTARAPNVLLGFLAALPALYLLLASKPSSRPDWPIRLALALYGVAWLQLIPLPPQIWTALPGRELAVSVLDVAGLAPGWQPLALDPGAAASALLSLVPALVVLVGFARLSPRHQHTILRAVILLAVLGALFGMLQRITGGLFLYDRDHAGFATGLFANRNHHAAFLACAIMLLPAARSSQDDRRELPIATAAAIVLFIGILATTSRAGIVLGSAALAASLALLFRPSRLVLLGGGAILALTAIALLQVPALAPVFDRFAGLAEDQRIIMAQTSWTAAREFFPWGSGWGSFVPVYMAFEDLDTMTGRYVVAAHNDYLQLAMEGGLPGMAIALAGPAALLALAARHWRAKAGPAMWSLWGAGVILLAHSTVDYPLRTGALAALLAMVVGAQEMARKPLPDHEGAAYDR